VGENLNSRIRSRATRALIRAQTAVQKVTVEELRNQADGLWPETARLFPFLRKLVVSVLLLSALSAVHFFGFVIAMPASIQRLVATSLAPEFSAVFIYHVALALLAARFATYAVAASSVSWKSWKDCRDAGKSTGDRRRFLREAKRKFSILEWPIFAISPFVLAIIYTDFWQTLITLMAIALIFVLLSPIAIPQAALAPKRFYKRLVSKHPTLKTLRKNINLLMLVAVALFATSFFLGKARYEHLATECVVPIRSKEYEGNGTILAQTEKATLVLEQDETRTHRRYIFFRDGFLVSDTTPHPSVVFEGRPLGDPAASAPKAASSAADSAASSVAPSRALACRASGEQ
jgi:hypothetical protein